MPDTEPSTLIHFVTPGSITPVCGAPTEDEWHNIPGRVTCFACRANSKFKTAQRGVEPPPPVRLSGVMAGDVYLQELASRAAAHAERSPAWLKGQRNSRGMYVVEEFIHHGEYRSTRRVELYALNMVTVDAVLQSSAYCYGSWLNPENPDYKQVRNEKLRQLVEDLKAGRENRGVGWSTFRLITDHSS